LLSTISQFINHRERPLNQDSRGNTASDLLIPWN
jgi:hypothetical protein